MPCAVAHKEFVDVLNRVAIEWPEGVTRVVERTSSFRDRA